MNPSYIRPGDNGVGIWSEIGHKDLSNAFSPLQEKPRISIMLKVVRSSDNCAISTTEYEACVTMNQSYLLKRLSD